ncbi:PadR family transcriptional regulator [Paenibacillus segetis]|uniref:PadR family transcriptional regulator n=1 Tax=Paenibacillus segetis TaxID=1325360 RepID=A0ABQ1YFT2_9BACL|nr:PadR family transcriptional regulator [Paenibacillus segetis]GGH23107.1 PadR family transcriptional regulator [Paenibacillus segetis]
MDIEVLILAQLMQGPKHGYEIKKNIIFVMSNSKIINNNTLYPKLKQFEERGLVNSKLELQERRPNRYVYSITSLGQETFHRCLTDFTIETIKSDDEWSIRLAYYELLDNATRQKLLTFRKTYMEEKITHLEQLSSVVGNGRDQIYSQELYFYTHSLIEREIELIQEMAHKLENK